MQTRLSLGSAKGFQLSGFDALPYGVCRMVYVETKSAKFLFGLQDYDARHGLCLLPRTPLMR
jgi:hypothetical protein